MTTHRDSTIIQSTFLFILIAVAQQRDSASRIRTYPAAGRRAHIRSKSAWIRIHLDVLDPCIGNADQDLGASKLKIYQ